MRRSIAGTALAAVAALAAAQAHAQEDPIAPFVGEWRDEAAILEVRDRGDGFVMRWGGGEDIAYEPTDRPGVYVESGGGGLFGVFGSSGPVEPLEGGVMRWIKIDGTVLSAHQFAVPSDGGIVLERTTLEPRDGGLAAALSRTERDGSIRTTSNLLQRAE